MRSSLLCGLVLALCWVAPAAAATDVDVIARALARSPLFVDRSLEGAVSRSERRRLERTLRAAPQPILVALIPIVGGDEYDGDAGDFLSVLHDRVGRDALYVTIQDGLLMHRRYGGSPQEQEAADQAGYVIIGEGPRREAPAAHVARFVAALADPDLAARYRRAHGSSVRPPPASDEPDGGGSGTGAWLAIAAGLGLAIATAAFVLVRRRRGAHYAREPLPVLPRRVFEHAREAAAEDLREHADAAVVGLAAALDPVDPPADAAAAEQYQLALDAYGAASNTLARARGVPDLAGVLALVDRGRAALAAAVAIAAGRRPPERLALCLFNPLHGRARRRPVAWRDGLRVPACARCAADLRAGRPPDALRDGAGSYLQTDGVWARTGYGALDDDLVARVLRGER